MRYEPKTVLKFIEESNHIEGVYDFQSHLEALYAFNDLLAEGTLNIRTIMKCHHILMNRHLGKRSGKFRTMQVWVGEHKPPPPEQVHAHLMDWWEKYKDAITEQTIKEAHIEFEKVHPFEDGNGRVGRMILNFQRLKAGLPILVILESERSEYYQWFR